MFECAIGPFEAIPDDDVFAKTIQILKNLFSSNSSSIANLLENKINRTVKLAKTFKKLTNASVFAKFEEFCAQKFVDANRYESVDLLETTESLVSDENFASAETVKEVTVAPSSESNVIPVTSPEVTAGPSTTSPLKTRQGQKCWSCHILRKSLQEIRLKHIFQRKARLSVSKAKKHSNATRVLNQKIKRKEKMLNQLKQTLGMSELGLKLKDTKEKL